MTRFFSGTIDTPPVRAGMFGRSLYPLNQISNVAAQLTQVPPTMAQPNPLADTALPPSIANPGDVSPVGPSDNNAFTYNDATKACYGFARGLAGNTALYGKQGAFGIVRPNTAAIIPYQFGQSHKAGLMPYVPDISGQLTSSDGTRSSWFRGITDVIDGKSPDVGIPVRDAMQRRWPGQLIIEVPGGQDVGSSAPVVLKNYPFGLHCPTGTGL